MIPTHKTDSFINILETICNYVDLYTDPLMNNSDIDDDWTADPSAFLNIYESYLILTNHLGNKYDGYKKTPEENINIIILLNYADDIEYTDYDSSIDAVECIKNGNYIIKNELTKKIIEEKKKIYKIVNEMEHVCLRDILDEFWTLCPDVEHIEQYIKVFDVKFQRIFPLAPRIKSLNFNKLMQIDFNEEIEIEFKDGEWKDVSIYLDELKINYPQPLATEYKKYLNETISELRNLLFDLKDMVDSLLSMSEEDEKEVIKNENVDLFIKNNRILLNNKSDEKIIILFQKLKESKYISQDAEFDSFKSIFHGNSTSNFRPIKWLRNKQLLRELLTDLKYNDINIAEMQRLTPTVFIDKHNKPLNLAKNKHIENRESKQLQKFLRLCE